MNRMGLSVLCVGMCLLTPVAFGWEMVRYEDPELGFSVAVPADWWLTRREHAVALDGTVDATFMLFGAGSPRMGEIRGFSVIVLQPPQQRLLFELPLEAVADRLFDAVFPDGSVLERFAGVVSGTPATGVRHHGPSGHPGRNVSGVMVTVRGTNTIYALAYVHGSQDPWRRDALLEEILASFELDAWSALERGDYAIAINLLLPAAEQGHGPALAWLGHLHEHGLGVQQDGDEALRWYRLAAVQGCGFSRAAIERLAGGWRGGE